MSDYYGNETVFKKPALPSRPQKPYSYIRACNEISNASEFSSNKIREKIEVLEKVFPQNDDIWENLARNIDHLCFVKVSESILPQNSQRSLINHGNMCGSISSQHTSSNLRFNCTQSTNNTREFLPQPNHLNNIVSVPVLPESQYRNSRSQNLRAASVPERSEEPDSRNAVPEFQYSPQRFSTPNETLREARNSRSKNKSSRINSESTKENNSSFGSKSHTSNTTLPKKRESTTNKRSGTSSKVSTKRPRSEESSNLEKRKKTKKDETVKENSQRAESALEITKKPARPKESHPQKNSLYFNEFNEEDSNDSLAAFFQKQRKLNTKKPSTVVGTDSGPSGSRPRIEEKRLPSRKTQDPQTSESQEDTLISQSQEDSQITQSLEDSQEYSSLLLQNTVVETKDTTNARRTKKPNNTQPRETIKTTVRKKQITAPREEDSNLEDISSQSPECSVVQTGNRRKPSKTKMTQARKTTKAEKVIKKVRKSRNSLSPDEKSNVGELDVPIHQGNRNTTSTKDTRPKRTIRTTVKKTQCVEDTDSMETTQSQESTVYETKKTRKPSNIKKMNRIKSISPKKPKSTTTRSKTTAARRVQSKVATQKKKTEAPSQILNALSQKTENNLASSFANRLQKTNGSFFSDVSSILGNESISLECLERGRKSKNRTANNEDTSMHFFSPFASANLRSTSGFSAISTPLSKSVAKDVLGKRAKKPSVVAELKNELKENRKKRRNKNQINVIQPVHEITATTESECEASDFSDLD